MLCLQLIWSTVVELAASDWQPPRGKGNKGHQQNVQAAITGETLHFVDSLWTMSPRGSLKPSNAQLP